MSGQITPFLTGGIEFTFKEGLSFTGGLILGDITHEISVTIGIGTLTGFGICALIAASPIPGARVVAGFMALVIFIKDIF